MLSLVVVALLVWDVLIMRADRKSQPSREPFAIQDLYMCTSLVRSFFSLFCIHFVSLPRCWWHWYYNWHMHQESSFVFLLYFCHIFRVSSMNTKYLDLHTQTTFHQKVLLDFVWICFHGKKKKLWNKFSFEITLCYNHKLN